LNGTTALNLSLVGGFTPSPSDVFYVMSRADGAAFSTLFSGTSEGGLVSLGGGVTGQITYLANWTGTQAGSSLTGGNDVAIYNVTAVPEPATFALFAMAGVTVAAVRRKSTRSVG
ncbi:MAG TPA: PEP-CTERM sorting domain-containing protein, partial [Pirellulales bacterium]